jgi:hypothetical protein
VGVAANADVPASATMDIAVVLAIVEKKNR